MTELFIHYGTSAFVLPRKVTEALSGACAEDLKVLLTLCADERLWRDCDTSEWLSLVAEKAGCDTESVTAALAFWRGAGIISTGKEGKARGAKKDSDAVRREAVSPAVTKDPVASVTEGAVEPVKARPQRSPELPRYTTEELANLLESRQETKALINECQRVWGKVFNTHDVTIILGLVDYLGLEPAYVLSLLAYYAAEQAGGGLKKSLRNVERKAFELYDKDIQTVEALQQEIQRVERLRDVESQLRTLFGMGGRALTPKEKRCFSAWLYEYGYDMEIIRMAYDVTVDAKGSPNISYMNSVLANWNSSGLRTPEDIQKAQEAYKMAQNKQDPSSSPLSSFDTDDFFSAAVRRSFGDGFVDENQ